VPEGHIRKTLALAPPLFTIPIGRSACAKVLARTLGPQHGQLVRRSIWKRSEKHRVQHAEHGGVDADAERQREHSNSSETGVAAKLAQAEAYILKQCFEPLKAPCHAHVLLDPHHVSQSTLGGV